MSMIKRVFLYFLSGIGIIIGLVIVLPFALFFVHQYRLYHLFQYGEPKVDKKLKHEADEPVSAPVVNPHPMSFITVAGKFDPELAKKVKLKVSGRYQNQALACNYTEKIIVYQANPDANGNYMLKVPIDYFKPDSCQYMMNDLKYSLEDLNGNAIAIPGGDDFRYFLAKFEYPDPTIDDDTKIDTNQISIKTIASLKIKCSGLLHCIQDIAYQNVVYGEADYPLELDIEQFSHDFHHYLTFKGHIDPTLTQQGKFFIEVTYIGPESADSHVDAPHKKIDYAIKPDASGNYSIKMPMRYFRGKMSIPWDINTAVYFIQKIGFARSVLVFHNLPENKFCQKNIIVSCNKELDCNLNTPLDDEDNTFSMHHNCTYQLDIQDTEALKNFSPPSHLAQSAA